MGTGISTMTKITMRTALLALAFLGFSAAAQAQDWYHDRDARYRGDQWRSHVFAEVRTDLDHIWSGNFSDSPNSRTPEPPRVTGQVERRLGTVRPLRVYVRVGPEFQVPSRVHP